MKRAALVVTAALVFASSASAFRPSARWILLRAADAQLARKVQTLKIEQDAVVYNLEGAPRGYRTTQTTWVRTPFQMREAIALPDGERVQLTTEKKNRADLPLRLLTAGPPATSERIADGAFADMRRYGVDTGVVSYGRFEGRIAYVIGARAWEEDRSQVWIDKETLHLLKVRVVRKGSVVEHRFIGWGAGDVEGLWPKAIERWENGALVSRLVTTSIERNEPVDRDLFTVR